MNKLQYHYNEFFSLRNYPTKEQYTTQHGYPNVFPSFHEDMYNKAVEACIAAKTRIDTTSVVNTLKLKWVIKNSNETIWAYDDHILIDDGKIFDLPDNVEFEEGEEFIANDHWFPIDLKDKYEGKTILHPDDLEDLRKSGRTRRVIHIKLKEEDNLKEVKEESQDELISEIGNILYATAFPISKKAIDEIKSKFTIQRK